MPQIIEVPGMGQVEFPDGMSDAQISSAIKANMQPQRQAPNSFWMGMNSINKGIAAIPDEILNTPTRLMNLGKMAYGSAAMAMGRPDLAPRNIEQDPNYIRALFDKAGFTKNRLEPVTSGQRIADRALQGAAAGMISPANSLRQMATNTALSGVGGAVSGAVKEATGNEDLALAAGIGAVPMGAAAIQSAKNRIAATELRKAQNAVRDQTIANAREAGYTLSPSETNPSSLNHALEGFSGKLSTRQLASQRNQEVTNQLSRNALGLQPDAALSPELMSQLRSEAFQRGYAPVAQAGEIRPGAAYRNALDDIQSKYQGAAASFPAAVSDDVKNMVDSLRVRKFDAGDALKMSQILRDNSAKSYASGDKGLGKAQRAAANAIEDQIERGLQGQGKAGAAMLSEFRDARTQMAKTHSVEGALREGTGNVQAQKLAAALRKGAPLSGELRTIGATAEAFPKNMQSPEMMGAVPGLSPLDFVSSAGTGTLGAAALGNPAGALLGAWPALRPVVRTGILSGPYQKAMGTPQYKNSMLAKFLAQGDISNSPVNAAILTQVLANQNQGE